MYFSLGIYGTSRLWREKKETLGQHGSFKVFRVCFRRKYLCGLPIIVFSVIVVDVLKL